MTDQIEPRLAAFYERQKDPTGAMRDATIPTAGAYKGGDDEDSYEEDVAELQDGQTPSEEPPSDFSPVAEPELSEEPLTEVSLAPLDEAGPFDDESEDTLDDEELTEDED